MRPLYTAIILTAFLLSFTALKTKAQNRQQQKTDSVFLLIKKYFNAKQIDSIYSLTSEHFKKNVSPEAFKDVSKFFSLGEIKQSSFTRLDNNKIAYYKLIFNTASSVLSIKINETGKLDYLYIEQLNYIAASSNPLKSVMDKQVDSSANLYIQKSNTTGLSIGILKDGKSYTYNYGETAKGNGKLPDANTVFEIGSITKTFTATILAYYVNEGKISLTDPITKYLPDSVAINPELQKIRIINLSNHTSGLSSLENNFFKNNTSLLNPYKNYTESNFFSDLKKCKLNTTPGEVYAYSNQAVGLLGIILEKISGKTYEQLVKQIITGPLKMKSTVQHLTPLLANRMVKVYDDNGNQTNPWDFDAFASIGCLRSTVNDLLVYAKANMAPVNSKLSKVFELTHQITFNKNPIVGLGWHLFIKNGAKYYWHNGGTGGSRSYLIFNIEKNTAVVVLSNSAGDADDVGVNIFKKLIVN
jgi:CubicO group peptidase (beta-lactamase class C family)